MASDEAVAMLRSEGALLMEAASDALDRTVPTYPNWTVADLVAHTVSVHRWVTELVKARSQRPIERRQENERRPAVLLDRYSATLAQLAACLLSADPSVPLWTLRGLGSLHFWQYRMAHETAVHRWDAQRAIGGPKPFAPTLALTGIPETLEIHVARPLRGRSVGAGGAFIISCTDAGAEWTVRLGLNGVGIEPGRHAAQAWAYGPVSDVWLFVMGRPAEKLSRSGATSIIADFEEAVRSLPGPKF